MQLVDHVFILLLFVLQPVHGAIESRYYISRVKAGQPAERVRFYRQTALVEWLFFVLLVAAPCHPVLIVLREQKYWLILETAMISLRLGAFGFAYWQG